MTHLQQFCIKAHLSIILKPKFITNTIHISDFLSVSLLK